MEDRFMKKLSFLAAAAAVLALAGMACGDEKPAPVAAPAVKVDAPKAPEAPKASEPVKVDAPAPAKAPEVVAVPVNLQDAGSITGVVKVTDPPRRKKIKMDADPKCAALHADAPLSDEVVCDANGNVQYAFVWIKTGLDRKSVV